MAIELEAGGLLFEASFRGAGATLRVYGPVGGRPTELLRFDDFIEGPHYHVPAEGDPIEFDQERLGVPLDWFVAQVRDHLGEMLTTAGYSDLLPSVDLAQVSAAAGNIYQMMVECVPAGYTRPPGQALRRAND
jgi:hypothetical protein